MGGTLKFSRAMHYHEPKRPASEEMRERFVNRADMGAAVLCPYRSDPRERTSHRPYKANP